MSARRNKVLDSIRQYSFSPKKTRQHVKVEYEKNDELKNTGKSNANTENIKQKRKISTKSPLKKDSKETKDLKWEPKNWNEIFENLKSMRSKSDAPVDTMGCDKCFDNTSDPKTKRFQILISLMLSSQTKDQVTYEAMKRLKSNNLTPKSIVEMDAIKLEQLINPVSFYKNKSKYIQKTSEILMSKYDGDIPNTVEELIKLPGVGPKMAHICMNSAWNIVTGIGVDVHVHRISNRLEWVRKPTKTPEETRKELESWLPYDYWNDINHLMVGFGQTICTPLKPKCNECLNQNICPFSSKKKVK